jgi:thiamine biosynthesis lipoprotein ApbE
VAAADEGPRVAAAAVTDALTTAFMLLSTEEITALCERSPGVEAWVLSESVTGAGGENELRRFGGLSPGILR